MTDDWGEFVAAEGSESSQDAPGRPVAPVEGFRAVLDALGTAQELLAAGEDPTTQLEQLAAGVRAAVDAEAAAAQRPMYYEQLDHFVERYLVRVYRRDLAGVGVRWCPEWWKHAEAIARLEGMWRAWEQLRWEPGQGGSTWWLMHADPHMRILLSDEGPFQRCRKGQHAAEDRLHDLPHTPAPSRMFEPPKAAR